MKCRVAIRRNSDDRVHVTRWQTWEYDLLTLEYLWMDGNYGCDCNRHQIFEDVRDADEERDDIPCGDTEYDVMWFEIDGTRYTPEQLVDKLKETTT